MKKEKHGLVKIEDALELAKSGRLIELYTKSEAIEYAREHMDNAKAKNYMERKRNL
jgi:hypothetical protein